MTAIQNGFEPAGIGAPAVLVAMLIGATASPPKSATYAVLPSGVTATPSGPEPALIAVPEAFVMVLIGLTALLFAT